MKKALALSKVYINSLYGISRFVSDIKKNRKSAVKSAALAILILFSLSGFISMFVLSNIKLFDVLKPVGQQGLIITNSIIFATLFIFVFGFMGIITTYFIDKEGDIILSMPLKPWEIFFGKFSTNYIYEAMVSFIIMSTGFIVYGIKSKEGIIFYIAAIVITALLPLIPLVINYLIIVPVMKVGSIFKKKDTVMIVAGFIGIAFAVEIQGVTQSLNRSIENPEILAEKLTSQNGLISIAGKIYPPSIWGTYAMTDILSIKGTLYFIAFAVTSILALILMLKFMSAFYIQSIVGSNEVKKSEKKYSEKEFQGKLKKNNKFYSLIKREVRIMNREPVYFLNGPMVILILPIIFGAMFYFQNDSNVININRLLSYPMSSHYATLGVAAIGTFLGVSTNITPSSISREGKAFIHIKSMPISPWEFVIPKLIHGGLFVVLASVISCIFGYVFLKLHLLNIFFAFVMSIAVSMPILIVGLLLELKWPKLDWDNLAKAMKQNVNVVIIMFGSIFILVILGVLTVSIIKTPLYAYVFIIMLSGLASACLYALLLKYSNKRFYEI
jgi:ABC-2 type transport system permease protein